MRALRKLILTELKLHIREPVSLVFTLVLPFIILIVMGEVFGRNAGDNLAYYRFVNPMDYYAPAYIGVVMLAIGVVAIPVHIAGYREFGILRRFNASSVPMRTLFLSQAAVSVLITVVCVFILIIPSVFIYHINAPHSLGLVLISSALAMLSYVVLGLFLGFILPSARAAQGVGIVLFFFMFMLSGGGPPRGVMSPIMQDVGRIMPAWHTTGLLQDAWLGYGWNVGDSLVMAGYMVAALVLTWCIFRRRTA